VSIASPGGGETFHLLPAIDLQGGHVVRLRQGDLGDPTVYDDDPSAVAAAFVEAGATWIHVVDLDAAAGARAQTDVVQGIVSSVGRSASCQVAGGLRDRSAVERMLDAGAARVVIGTAALRDPRFAGELVARFGPTRVVAAIDVRDGRALGDGWRSDAVGVPMVEAMRGLAEAGVGMFAVTAIDRDGILGGPDLDLLAAGVGLGLGRVLASGGISSTADLLAVRAAGAAGAIVGRAIYEGRLDLRDALATLAGTWPTEGGPGRSAHSDTGR
jgi:phosphoribosylformimino-5-aminoimidazole carboxamide ribotide isomerase